MRRKPSKRSRPTKAKAAKPQTCDSLANDHVDRFFIPAVGIPKGRSYQWIARSVYGIEVPGPRLAEFLRDGWKLVPRRRHIKRFPGRVSEPIEIDGQVLCERSAAATRKAQERDRAAAKALGSAAAGGGGGFSAPVASRSADWDHGPFDPTAVEVPVPLYLSSRLVEAAKICDLPIEEYARRMVILLLRGAIDGLLHPSDDKSGFELLQIKVRKDITS